MSKLIGVNGEEITPEEQAKLYYMILKCAEEYAGKFYEKERSEKWRLNWPDQEAFIKSEWKNFVEATIEEFCKIMSNSEVPTAVKDDFANAIIVNNYLGIGRQKDTRIQLRPNTQQFEGDKYENRKIVEKFGKKPNYRALLKNTVADITKH